MFKKLGHQKIAMQRQSCICCSHSGIKVVKLISVVVTLSLTYSTSAINFGANKFKTE